MKHFVLYLLLLCPMGLCAQSATEQAIDSIMNYLALNCLDGSFVIESNGRNHAKRGEIAIDNGPMAATRKLINGIRPYIDQLPHLRKMTDERAGEVFEGRIAMRLQPEPGDTSAYFLMTYNRSKLTFKYGVNSPGSISLTKSSAKGLGVGFSSKGLSAEEAAPVTQIYEKFTHRKDARVVDTVFVYDGEKDYEWWLGATGERSRTKAQIILLPSPTEKDMQEWLNIVNRYGKHPDVTLLQSNRVIRSDVYLASSTCTFIVGGAFHLYLAGLYHGHFCLVRVIARSDQPGEVVPSFARLIDHLTGAERTIHNATGHPTKLVQLMEKEISNLQSQAGAEVIDTLFLSNDHEGHIWWTGIDSRCPTRASLVRAPSSEKDFASLHQRIRKSIDNIVNYQAWTDDDTDEDRRIILLWTDGHGQLHAYIIYYMIATHNLIIERADGEEPGSICIPHYKQKWFE